MRLITVRILAIDYVYSLQFNAPQVISIEMKTTTETAQDHDGDPKSGLNQV